METLIGASIDKAHYSKAQWKEVTQKLKKGETKQVIEAALLEVQGRRGRKSTYVILEEMLPSEDATILIGEIQKVLSEWKQVDDADIILPYIFAALVKGCLTNEEYNYRTFHAFPTTTFAKALTGPRLFITPLFQKIIVEILMFLMLR